MHQHCCNRPSKYSPVTHVIFDLDGTIIDSERVYGRAFKHVVESFDVPYEDDFILKVQGRVQYDGSKIAVEHFNLPCSIEKFMELYLENANQFLSDLNLMPGAERIINHLHKFNVPISIATSSAEDAYQTKTEKFPELFSKFHHVVCGGTDPEVHNGKPAPDIFLVAASRFDEPIPEPNKCLVFEDSVQGMKAGLAAGMQVIIIPEPMISYEDWKLATLRLDSFNYMMPELFDLPPFPDKEIAKEFDRARVIKYGDSSFRLPQQQDSAAIKTNEEKRSVETEEEKGSIETEEEKGSIKADEEQKSTDEEVELTKDETEPDEAIEIELPEHEPSIDEDLNVKESVVAEEPDEAEPIDFGEPQAESSRTDLDENNDLNETEDEKFVTAIEGEGETAPP
ncbi:unnamed protein product [Ceutorhynchus assimilis]|uniref:Pseudouridine-5'-phosphatase n=1 Tax=Ceutorhynchus assimilis TaxID=467358 RepID=A0A9N9MVU4_9CUCU|nr:unnamed protein product [Ceutorhynchus assimilis]